MANHIQQNRKTRGAVAASAAIASLAVLTPNVAQAQELNVPGTVTGVIDQVSGVADQFGLKDTITSVTQQASTLAPGDFASAAEGFAPLSSNLAPSAPADDAAAPVANSASAEPVVEAQVSSVGQQIVNAAYSAIGAPYVWGAAGPSSFDCSGLTTWAYGQVGKAIPRTSQAQAAQGQQVSLSALQPGDIIVYYSGASHVGIYTGHGTIIDALNSGTPVGERDLNYMPIHSAVRF